MNTPENQRLAHLLALVAQKDHVSFKRLYDLTSSRLYSVAMRLVQQPALADAVLQDAYISVWERADSYASASTAPLAWLVATVREHALRRDQRK